MLFIQLTTVHASFLPCGLGLSGFEATYDELDGTHNGLVMWKHFGGQKTSRGLIVHASSGLLYESGLSYVQLHIIILITIGRIPLYFQWTDEA